MGDDAWERAATDDERAQLASVLADSVAAGALGMSTSFIDVDRHGRAVPSRAADDAELRALVEVLAAAPGRAGLLEFLPWIKEPERWRANIEQVARLCGPLGVPCTWNQLAQNSRDPERAALVVEQAHRLHADGARVWAQVSPRPFDLNVSFDATPAFVAIAAWNELVQLSDDDKRRTLVDDAWRARARADWDAIGDGFTIFPVSRIDRVRLTGVAHGRGALRGRHARRRRRGARRSPLRRARRLGARTRPRAGRPRRGALQQRPGQGVATSSATPPRWWARATPARTCR